MKLTPEALHSAFALSLERKWREDRWQRWRTPFQSQPQKHSTVRGPFFAIHVHGSIHENADCRARFRSWGCRGATVAQSLPSHALTVSIPPDRPFPLFRDPLYLPDPLSFSFSRSACLSHPLLPLSAPSRLLSRYNIPTTGVSSHSWSGKVPFRNAPLAAALSRWRNRRPRLRKRVHGITGCIDCTDSTDCSLNNVPPISGRSKVRKARAWSADRPAHPALVEKSRHGIARIPSLVLMHRTHAGFWPDGMRKSPGISRVAGTGTRRIPWITDDIEKRRERIVTTSIYAVDCAGIISSLLAYSRRGVSRSIVSEAFLLQACVILNILRAHYASTTRNFILTAFPNNKLLLSEYLWRVLATIIRSQW